MDTTSLADMARTLIGRVREAAHAPGRRRCRCSRAAYGSPLAPHRWTPSRRRSVPVRPAPGRRTGSRHETDCARARTPSRPHPTPDPDDGARRRQATPGVDAAGTAVRPDRRGGCRPHRGAAGPWGGRGARSGCRRAVPAGVLRHLVGLDELHLVRLVLRHRRRAVPAAHPAADERGPRPRHRSAGRVRHRGTTERSPSATS
jgi:hypothetical protein